MFVCSTLICSWGCGALDVVDVILERFICCMVIVMTDFPSAST